LEWQAEKSVRFRTKPTATQRHAKRRYLQQKRANKRGDGEVDSDDDGGAAAGGAGGAEAGSGHAAPIPPIATTTTLSKSGQANKWSTVFARESDEDVELRRNLSMAPWDAGARARKCENVSMFVV
jgi:hypothetical protein